ncbi:unnamed protein product [Colias eurytheme]|nr:unnamed protein product [Colias eurytheme]
MLCQLSMKGLKRSPKKTPNLKIKSVDKDKRKNNLVFFGIEEGKTSTETELVDYIKDIIIEMGVHFEVFEINNIYRIGKKALNKNRPVVVSLTTTWKKHVILRNRPSLPVGINIKEDFPKEILEKRKQLQQQVEEEKKKGNIAFIKYDKLIIKKTHESNREKRKRETSRSPKTPLQKKVNAGDIEKHSGKSDIDHFYDCLAEAIKPHYNNNIIIMGDFNAQVGERQIGEEFVIGRSLIDQGSQASFITEAAVQLLGLRKKSETNFMSGLGGDQRSPCLSRSSVVVKIQSRLNPSFVITVKAHVLTKLTSFLPSKKVEIHNLPVFTSLQLADPSFHTPNKIDLLLGADVYSQILLKGLVRGPPGTVIAQHTAFGWILSGKIHDEGITVVEDGSCNNVVSMHLTQCNENELLKKFWELESEPTKPKKYLTLEEESSHFLVGEPLVSVPEANYEGSNINSLKRWQLTQRMSQDFWRRWSREYLTQLQHRYKWSASTPELEIGSVVLVKEDDLPPTRWLFGLVVDKHPGLDKLTRVVTLKYKGNLIKRPLSKLILLPVKD